ncbi:hypothetical protein DD630_10645 [Streptomyces sp. BSE7F]|nr:hypothetical protein DD630_10645 [Streptomyces sp. BSE7F]
MAIRENAVGAVARNPSGVWALGHVWSGCGSSGPCPATPERHVIRQQRRCPGHRLRVEGRTSDQVERQAHPPLESTAQHIGFRGAGGSEPHMGKNYASPSAFRAALTQAAKNMSKKTGMSVSDLMKIFYFNRLAARVFTKEPDGWLIKGGQALLVRYRGAARLSQDIDLQCAQPERTAEEARELVIAAASLDLGDYLRFVPGRFLRHSDEGRGGAQYFTVFLGQTNVAAIKVDLVVGRTWQAPLRSVPCGPPSTSPGPSTGPKSACTQSSTTSPTRSAPCTSATAKTANTDPTATVTWLTFS